jgi:hypothetical protein
MTSLHFHTSNGMYHLRLASQICHTPLSAGQLWGLHRPWEDDQCWITTIQHHHSCQLESWNPALQRTLESCIANSLSLHLIIWTSMPLAHREWPVHSLPCAWVGWVAVLIELTSLLRCTSMWPLVFICHHHWWSSNQKWPVDTDLRGRARRPLGHSILWAFTKTATAKKTRKKACSEFEVFCGTAASQRTPRALSE